MISAVHTLGKSQELAAGLIKPSAPPSGTKKPRLGFLGVGWIGRSRLEALSRSGLVEISALADTSSEMRAQAVPLVPGAESFETLEELLEYDLDGIVVATPSALHAEQAIAALERGVAVFCQKPLARSAAETRKVISAARTANRLLGVDLSYRFIEGVPQLRGIIQRGELGKIYAADLVFHNAYGPDKAWFYDRARSGGGCVIDLGIHLVDLVLWVLGGPGVHVVSSQLFAQGKPCGTDFGGVEDFAIAQLRLEDDVAVQLACSWKIHAGCDAAIHATFYGTKGGIEFRNVKGSFYDFVVERFSGTERETLAMSTKDWSGRAAVDWANGFASGGGYEHSTEGLITVAETLDAIYGSSFSPQPDKGISWVK